MKYLLILFVFFTLNISAENDFEAYKKKDRDATNSYSRKSQKLSENYFTSTGEYFEDYKKEIKKLWGEFIESTPKSWVSYNRKFKSKSSVDFLENKINIQAIAKNKDEAGKLIENQLKVVLSEKENISGSTLLKDQVKLPNKKNKILQEKITPEQLKEIIGKSKKNIIIGTDGKERVAYEINLELIPESLQVRAKRYKPFVIKMCKKYEIEPAVAMAIIHTESAFNPKAYNRNGNAYGLMQIVPKYAGATMNDFLYHKRRKPSGRELFNAKKNLEFGIGYLHWLKIKKWERVKNKNNLSYIIICSYNGGVGSVYKAMTGKMKKIGDEKFEKMFNDLNKMSSKKLFKKLIKKIPFEETRNYLKIVTKRMKLYKI